jgi:RNA polymerase sigma-70 factor (ECF subfamily)
VDGNMPPHDAARPATPTDVALWEEFAMPLRAFVRRRVPHTIDPNDVVQEIFLRIMRHLPTLGEVERLDAWIFQVARTAIADALRANGRRQARTVDLDTDTLEGPAEDSAAALGELAPCLVPFVRRLEEPYRSALELTALGGLTQQQAAEHTGITLSGMKSRVQRARAQVRQLLGACCALEYDTRGSVMDYEVRDPSACGPTLVPLTRPPAR